MRRSVTGTIRFFAMATFVLGPILVLGGCGATRTEDTLAADVAWTRGSSPHRIPRDVVVAPGATLRIEPGAVVSFARGARLIVRGTLLAEGSAASRIRFEGDAWEGVALMGASGPNALRHVDISGTRGKACLDVQDSVLHLLDVSFDGIRSTIVETRNSSLRIDDCVFPPVGEHEVIHGEGIPPGGSFVVRGCTFHRNEGFNDIVDFSWCKLPGPVPVFEGNVFLGGGDDGLDLDGCDAVVSGNSFAGFHQDRHEHTSEALSTDNGARVLVEDNVFYDCDHGSLAKGGALLEVRRCVFVDLRLGAMIFREREWPPGGARIEDCVFWMNGDGTTFPDGDVATELVLAHSILPEARDWPAGGNVAGDPLLIDAAARDFRLRPESPWFTMPHATEGVPGGSALDAARTRR